MLQYLVRIGIALSVLFNVILGGESNQTFSARNYGWLKESRLNFVILIDSVFGKGHCMVSWVYWRTRK